MKQQDIKAYMKTVQTRPTGRMTKNATRRKYASGSNGSITGYAATFDHDRPDSYGDVIRKGAFLKSLERLKKEGHFLPLLYGHDMSDIIGRVTEIKEDMKGLFFTAEFFPTERAQSIRQMCIANTLWSFSFAYNTLKSARVTLADGTKANELQELDIFEISIVICPANDRATMISAKDSRDRRRKALVRMIDEISADQKERQLSLMAVIDSKEGKLKQLSDIDIRREIKHCRDLKEECLLNIEQARKKKDMSWLSQRRQALKAINDQINILTVILGRREKNKKNNLIKTDSRPITEPKAIIR